MQVLMKGHQKKRICSLFGGGEGGVERWGDLSPVACGFGSHKLIPLDDGVKIWKIYYYL